MRIVPCGPKSEGYSIKLQSEQLKAVLPALKWGLMFLKVALATQGLGSAVPDVSSFFPDSDYLGSMAASVASAAGLSDAEGHIDAAINSLGNILNDEKPFTFLAEFLRQQEGYPGSLADWEPAMTGLVKVSCVTDGSVMWVSPEAAELYREKGMDCLARIK